MRVGRAQVVVGHGVEKKLENGRKVGGRGRVGWNVEARGVKDFEGAAGGWVESGRLNPLNVGHDERNDAERMAGLGRSPTTMHV